MTIKVRCTEFGNCPLADGGVHEVESLKGASCPMKEDGSRCGMVEAGRAKAASGGGLPVAVRIALTGVAALALVGALGGGGWWAIRQLQPSCAVHDSELLLTLDPKAGELARRGKACLARGFGGGDLSAMLMSVRLLRAGADKGAPEAALTLARLYDPLDQGGVLKSAKHKDVAPPPDAAIAVHFYDLAAKNGDATAAASARALRARYDLPAADGSQAADARGLPLRMSGYPDFYQRVLARPGATLSSQPQAGGAQVAALTLFYVFERRPGWLRVGRDLQAGAEGWMPIDKGQDWQVMLVGRYTAQAGRAPVLFFKDDLALASILTRPGGGEMALKLVADVKADKPDPRLAAVEDQAVDWAAKPYVMPVLAARSVVSDDGRTVTLARVASISGAGSETTAATPAAASAGCDGVMRHGVVFVIDTTKSMGPYIRAVERIARSWADEVRRRGIADKVSFGLIAYRNNMDQEPQKSGLEYVTKVAAPLRPGSGVDAFLTAVSGLTDARVSTQSIDEDAVSGLRGALDQNWAPFCAGAKMIVVVTDAGALEANDPKAHYPGQGLLSIASEARTRQISIYPAHLETREGHETGDFSKAQGQWKADIGGTGLGGASTYVAVPADDMHGFDSYLGRLSTILSGIETMAKNGRLALPPAPSGKPTVDQLINSDLFAVQQRFLGQQSGATAPQFTASWTSDRDLSNLNRASLDIGVWLTRRQLNQLAEQTERLVEAAKRADLESDRFFTALSMVAAATTQDPAHFGERPTELGALLPSFLTLLPYKSDILSLNSEGWRSMGAARQNAFINRLAEKVRAYRDLEKDQTAWRSLGSSDSGDAVTMVRLGILP